MNFRFFRRTSTAVEPTSPTDNPATRHEPNDVNIRALAWVAGVFVAMLALVFFGAWNLWQAAEHHETRERAPLPPPMRVQMAPSAPRLETDVGEDEAALRARQQAELNSYGWVDRAHGQARIPIQRAMDLVAGGETRTN